MGEVYEFKKKIRGRLDITLLGTGLEVHVVYETEMGNSVHATRILEVLAILKDSEDKAHEIDIQPAMTDAQFIAIHDAILDMRVQNNA